MNFNSEKYLSYFYFDKPIVLKQDGERKLEISPVKVKDYFNFFSIVDILIKEKNRIPDVKIISMSYMDYLLTIIDDEIQKVNNLINSGVKQREIDQEVYITYLKFFELIRLCMNIEYKDVKYGKKENGKHILILNGFEINKKDFDEIRGIICEQNCVEVPDEKIDPKLKEALDEALRFKNRNNAKMGTLEDQMICLMSEYQYNIDEIKELSIRKFNKMLERADYKLHYQIYKNAEMQGTQFKSKIHHWMSEIIKDKYADVVVGYSEIVGKFEGK